MKIFIYEGFYYPVIGCKSVCFGNSKYRNVWSKKLGGYVGWLSWLPYIGIKCKVKNRNKPYKQYVINTIMEHPEMTIIKHYFDNDNKDTGYMWSVVTVKNNDYIGDIATGYGLTNLINLSKISGTICYGWDPEKKRACGWSHRAMFCFKKGDKVFNKSYGTEKTPYSEHGKKTIKGYSDAMEAAREFAKYVS